MEYEFNLKNPAFDRIVFLLTVNKNKMTERVIIGEAGEVRLRLERNIGDGADVFKDKSAILFKPFHVLSEYKPWKLEAVNALQTALHAEESQVELWYPVSKRPFECVVAYSSFLPIIFYYLNKIREWGLVFQECKVCNSYFLTKSKHFEICGDECRKAQAIEARRQFDERNKYEKVEAIYENHYQYWYNRLRRLKTGNAAEADVTAFANTFNKFRKEAVKRKNEVKSGKIKLSAFTSWLAEQQSIVDSMVKRGGEKWK
jgi:hypothetical protein